MTSSLGIASTLELAIQREQDLAVSTGAYLIDNPGATEGEFSNWVTTSRIFTRFPEITGLAEVVLVPDAGLPAFAAGAQTSGQPFVVEPAGNRPYYCFETVTDSRTAVTATPAGLDLCDTALGPALIAARDSGQGAYAPYGSGSGTQMVVGTPIYAGGTVPATSAGRLASFLGWTGTQIDPARILAAPLATHPGDAVVFAYHQGSNSATIRAGKVPAHAESTTIDLHNGWQVDVLSPSTSQGVLSNSTSLAILLGGIALSLLLALLVYVLGTSRSRALALVSERTDQLRHQAMHDTLTGLPNRALILDRLGQMLAQSRRRRVPVAVLFIDLDDFKDINDTMGHRAGDELLVAVGARLGTAVREGDTVGRLGGDEFVVLTMAATPGADAEVVADRVLGALSPPVTLPSSDVALTIHASIGIAEGDHGTPEELLQDADIALYQAKARGKDRAVRFVPSMQAAVDHHRHLEVDLQSALEDQEFFLVYQPTFDLPTGQFCGVGALLRWQHPDRGVVQPDEFLPALESGGLIVPVGAWVLHEACRQGAAWARDGHQIAVSVNVSARQLDGDRLVDDVEDALSMSGLAPDGLVLELNEMTLMHDAEASVARLQSLKVLGVRVAVGDFGTGYSSLAYLRQFPIDVLRIDRSFVSGITDSSEASALIHTLGQLGRVLGIQVVAEGVETSGQLAHLQPEDADARGFHFSHPMTVTEVDRFLGSGGTGAPDAIPGRALRTSSPR
jgi:diguanylate cyclase (GGDEF)-like protein